MVDALIQPLPIDRQRIMVECCRRSTALWFGLIDSKVACVWGVALPTLLSNRAYLWLWTSDVIKGHPFVLVRRAQMVIRELLDEFEVVVGVVDLSEPGADSSIRWLKLLKAKFGESSKGLLPFEIREK